MSKIGTDFHGSQADLWLPLNRPTIPTEEDVPFFFSRVRKRQPKKILSIGTGCAMVEMGVAKVFPDVSFVLVEPSLRQLKRCHELCAAEGLDPARFELVAGVFKDFVPEYEFDQIWSIDSWFYAHSDSELKRAVKSLRPGGEFNLRMMCAGGKMCQLISGYGIGGESGLGHLLTAEELIASANSQRFEVEVEFVGHFGEPDVPEPFLRIAAMLLRIKWPKGADATDIFKQVAQKMLDNEQTMDAFFAHKLGRPMVETLAYLRGVPVDQLDIAIKRKMLQWHIDNAGPKHMRYGNITIKDPFRRA